MSDNVTLGSAVGVVAADEVVDGVLGTVKVQYVKLMDATIDGTTKAAVGAGGLKVDPTSSVAMNTGARSATTLRVTVATDDSVPVTIASVPSHAITNAGTFAVQNTAATPAGTNVIGHVIVDTAPTTAVTLATAPALVAGSAVIGKVGIDQTTPGTTNGVVVNNANTNGRAVPGSSAPVVLNSMTYSAKAASSTAALFGATGASGDYLDGVLIIPATAAAGAVSITDGGGSAITIFAGGGTTALPTLAPFFVPIGAISSGGAGGWKVTTGASVSVIGIGNFT